MAHIISVHSFRGGTGKSNVTANLAASVAYSGKRVGIVDTDIQSPGIHVIFQFKPDEVKATLNDYLWGRKAIDEVAYDMTHQLPEDRPAASALYLIPSSLKSIEIARILREGYQVEKLNDGFHELIRALDLDFLFIDTHPGVNEETLLSIALSNRLILIMRPDHQDFQGTSVTVELARRLDVADITLIVNKIPQNAISEPLIRKIESSYGIPVAAQLPLNSEIAGLGSASLFINAFPDHPFSLEIKRLAHRIAENHAGASNITQG